MEDEIIINLFWERSQDALRCMDRKYGRLIKSLASDILRDARDAEEAVSDTYMKLWDSIPPARPKHLLAYTAKLCRNRALDILRTQQRQKRRGDVFYSELDECLPSGEDVSAALESRELAELINGCLRSLDAVSCALFLRRYFAMEELETLAADFGMTKNAVSVRLHRIRAELRKQLEKEGITV